MRLHTPSPCRIRTDGLVLSHLDAVVCGDVYETLAADDEQSYTPVLTLHLLLGGASVPAQYVRTSAKRVPVSAISADGDARLDPTFTAPRSAPFRGLRVGRARRLRS